MVVWQRQPKGCLKTVSGIMSVYVMGVYVMGVYVMVVYVGVNA